jgi:hypothetical protein
MLFLPAPGSPTVKAATVGLTFVNIGGSHPRQNLGARRVTRAAHVLVVDDNAISRAQE